MTQIVSRTYHDPQNAADAVAKLKSTGFAEEGVHLVAPAADRSDGDLAESIAKGGVVKDYVPIYAEALRRGETLVSVRAAFGCAATVTNILQEFGPTDTGLGDPGYEHPPYDPAAPLSSKWGWTVLIDNPAPLSTYLGWPTLLTGRPTPKPQRSYVHNPAPLSKMIGWRTLSDRVAPLSQRFGWPLLSENAAPLSARFGWRVLSAQQTAPQKRFGLRLLSSNPAPLSSALGMKLLSNNPAPLSSLLNWRVLSRNADESDA